MKAEGLNTDMTEVKYENHFKEDSFGNREALAKQLDAVISRIDKGVIVIDAPWGEGKSWFTERYEKHLKNRDHRAIRIDAFKDDYLEDPFLMIVSEIAQLISDDDPLKEGIKNKAASIATSILPVASKILFNALGRSVGVANLSGTTDKIVDDILEASSQGIENVLRAQIDGLNETKKVMSDFITELAVFASSKQKPVVIIIDELDRCRPDFAVKILEVIKHLFNVKNIFFVLSVNRQQLERAIKGVYGAEIDAEGYIYKFVDLFLTLPKIYVGRDNFSIRYMRKLIDATGMTFFEETAFWETLVILSCAYNLSPRDIDRVHTMLTLSAGMGVLTPIFLVLSVMSIKSPELFSRIVRGDNSAWFDASEKWNAFSGSIGELLSQTEGERMQSIASFFKAVYHNTKIDYSSFSDLGGYPKLRISAPPPYSPRDAANKVLWKIENLCPIN